MAGEGTRRPAGASGAGRPHADGAEGPLTAGVRGPHGDETPPGALGSPLEASGLARLRYGEDGLVPVVAQDRSTGAVLMLAWADQESLARSIETGRMTYWSRSRGEMWEKGATSGHTQRLVSLHADCDRDAVLAVVEQEGPACHNGTGTCWSDAEAKPVAGLLGELDRLIAARHASPAGRYTDTLLADPGQAAAKVEEEAAELARVVRGQDNEDPLAHEAADLLYHALVALRAGAGDLGEVLAELARRRSDK